MKHKSRAGKRGVEKRSVSASAALFEEADKIASKRLITNFSEYVRSLIQRDLRGEFDRARA